MSRSPSRSSEPTTERHPLARLLSLLDGRVMRSSMALILGVLLALLFGYDLVVGRHDYAPIAETLAFYVGIGLFGAAVLVLAVWPLRVMLSRPGDYYGDHDD